MKEKISQLVDQELSAAERDRVLASLAGNPESVRAWRDYHLIGNIIRDEVDVVGSDLSENIARSLENEPVVIAPGANPAPRATPDLWRPVAMFAVAASMALVAVVTLGPVNQPVDGVPGIASSPTAPDFFSSEFDEMLVEHGEFTASSGLNGLVAYAKLVSDQDFDR